MSEARRQAPFHLTAKQRRQILRGDYPFIPLTKEEAATVNADREIEITRERLWLVVVGVRRDRKKGLHLEYKIRDSRVRFMKRGGGYTHVLDQAVAQEDADVVPEEWQEEFTRRSKEQWDVLHYRKNTKQELNRLTREIRNKTLEAERRGIDPALAIKRLEGELAKLEAEIKEAA